MAPLYESLLRIHTSNRSRTKHINSRLKPLGITEMQYVMLGVLSRQDAMRVTDLAREMDTSMAFVTTTLNLLESKGLIKRSVFATDNRAKLVGVTAEGTYALDKAEELVNKIEGIVS